PSQTGRWNLNNDCDVKTGPAIPGICNERRLQLACELVELRPDSASSEGLVVVGLYWTARHRVRHGSRLERSCRIPRARYPITGRYKPNPSDPTENTTVEQLNCKPPMPSPTLVCYRQEARICFGTNAISSMSELQLMYNATEVSGCVVISEVTPAQSYSTCAAVSGQTAQYTQYHLLMRFLGEKNSIGNYVRPPMSFDLYCRLAKETLATGQSIGPDFVTPTSAIDGHSGRGLTGGNFTDGPISGSVEVGTILYARWWLRGAANLTSSWLVVNSCWATDGQQNATLVENKCPRDGSVILIPAFMFNTSSGGIGSGSMQLLCSTIVCRLGDPSEQCSRQCHIAHRDHSHERREIQVRLGCYVNRATTIVLAPAGTGHRMSPHRHQDNGEFGLLEEDSDLQTGVHGLEIWLDRERGGATTGTKVTTGSQLCCQPGSFSNGSSLTDSADVDRAHHKTRAGDALGDRETAVSGKGATDYGDELQTFGGR
uniref:ZP domain-containing protein n=1 Tax=Macrostomum lignano TaxID=282301 RepID=A0A1I8JP17_9PLAT